MNLNLTPTSRRGFRLGPVSVLLVLCVAGLSGSWSAWSASRDGVAEFRRLFKILDAGGSLKEIGDRSRWPNNPLLTSYLDYELLSHPDRKSTFAHLHGFLERWPDHPMAEKVRRTLDTRYLTGGTDGEALAWYDKREMRYPTMHVRYLELLIKAGREAEAVKPWRKLYREGVRLPGFLFKSMKAVVEATSAEDHEARAWALLEDENTDDLREHLSRLTKPKRKLFEVLLEAQGGGKKFDQLLGALPEADRKHPAVWAERIKGLQHHGKLDKAIALLEGPEGRLLKREDRLSIRFKIARTVLFLKRDAALALRIVSPNMKETGSLQNLEESFWLVGWSAHTSGNRKLAIDSFSRLGKDGVSHTLRTQGAYWAGKLRQEAGEDPSEWFRLAAAQPDTFYGLLALEEREGRLAKVPAGAIPCDLTLKSRADVQERLRRMAILKEAGRGLHVESEILWLGENLGVPVADQLCLAEELGAPALAVKTALQLRKESKERPIYWNALFPIPEWSPLKGWRLDTALVWSVVRQESRYNLRAESGVGATGLMQLMPATAKQEAIKLGLPRSTPARLRDPEYNLELGQSYLRRMLQSFDGDLVQALVAYNAGPGRAAKWADDRADMDGLNYIERIPFTETRHYVKHIVHSLAAYRLRMGQGATVKGLIEKNKPGFEDLDYSAEG